MRPVMTIIIHIGYTEGSLCRELSLPGGSEVSISSPGRWWSHSWPMLCWGTVVSRVMPMYVDKGWTGRCARGYEVAHALARHGPRVALACEPGTVRRPCGAAERWIRETSYDKIMACVL
jgi:hypothetical protein